MLERIAAARLPKRADVVVIGGGVVGCAIARELCRYSLTVVLLERAPDVATGRRKPIAGSYTPVSMPSRALGKRA